MLQYIPGFLLEANGIGKPTYGDRFVDENFYTTHDGPGGKEKKQRREKETEREKEEAVQQ